MNQPIRIKRIVTCQEDVFEANDVSTNGRVKRAWAAAVINNPVIGLDDMAALTEVGETLGERLGEILLAAICPEDGELLAYGKSAIVGGGGLLEHGAAVLHPKLGKPLRALIGQGKSIIPSTVKQATIGASIDIPLHAADNEWDFAMLDAITAMVPGAPLNNEIVVFVALARCGRPAARIGIKA
jgi:hypothetical protein